MPGFHSVTHVPTLQQAQTIVREQSLFGTGKEVDVEALKVAEFVDNYCDSHNTTKFPEDLSRLLIAAFKAGQNNVMAYVPESPSKAEEELRLDILEISAVLDIVSSRSKSTLDLAAAWIFPVIATLLAIMSGIIYIALVVSR
jgi:hypothetical protein